MSNRNKRELGKPGRPQQSHHRLRLGGGNSSLNPDRVLPKGKDGKSAGGKTGHYRDAATIKRLLMYKQTAVRDAKGNVVGGKYMSQDTSHSTRIQPDRRWFGNTRTVGQAQLEHFRQELGAAHQDPYSVILRQNKLPWGLLADTPHVSGSLAASNAVTSATFQDTFGPKAKRKRPNLKTYDLNAMASKAAEAEETYSEDKDQNLEREEDSRELVRACLFEKGQSKRIWAELYKVIDSSDVIVQVLDARDPMGTRCHHIEKHLKEHAKHKHLVFVLNKCDLVPTWVTKKWVTLLSPEYPTLAMHASIQHPFGKGALIQLLRQFSHLHKDKKQICVGFIGYPNVGKSSIINTLSSKKVCNVAPVPGETKVWQYITLFKRVFLIDCPGVVYEKGDSDTDSVLKGVVRVEKLPDPVEHVATILERVRADYIRRTYHISQWTDHVDFLTQLAKKSGKLLKKGEADLPTMAKKILHDWQRGKLPYFVPPPLTLQYKFRTKSTASLSAKAAASLAAKQAVELAHQQEKKQQQQQQQDSDETEKTEEEEDELDEVEVAGGSQRQVDEQEQETLEQEQDADDPHGDGEHSSLVKRTRRSRRRTVSASASASGSGSGSSTASASNRRGAAGNAVATGAGVSSSAGGSVSSSAAAAAAIAAVAPPRKRRR
mmetsp:Transcript_3684/g.8920  ORF Transcript_3684/g.8920 Transcript_3684/m.8920 type:complete len:659 (-) Transcript_3684:84-2060(-)